MKNLNRSLQDLTQEVLELQEFQELKKTTKKLNADSEALSILEDLQAKRQTAFTLERSGLSVSATQKKDLEEAFAKMRANKICMDFVKAQNEAVATARKICNHLTEKTGIPFAGGGGCCG
jgi:cell fate (sporulation/competence/biofilm development) regulator YlbF (YheA/YmcA/DUF963 family)